MQSELHDFFRKRKQSDIHKWSHYFSVYEKFFSGYKDKPIVFMEIGVDKGGSLAMWREYFHPDSVIIGVDINPDCKKFEVPEKKCFVEIGDQSDHVFLNSLAIKYGRFDIVLDDGSHFSKHQIASLNHLWKDVKDNGLYMVEDLGCSYWLDYGGGSKIKGTFIEYFKELIDEMNAWFRPEIQQFTPWTSTICGMHLYPGIAVLEKGHAEEPTDLLSNAPDYKVPAGQQSRENFLNSYMMNATFLRRLNWKAKCFFYLCTGDREKYDLYRYQLKLLKKIPDIAKGHLY